MNFFKLYIGDYQRDTAHLSIAEHGAYMLMLQHYYATEKPLPVGKALHRMLRAQDKTERDAIDAVASQFWSTTEAGLVNERADKEIDKASEQAITNARIAREREARRKAERTEHDSCSVRSTKHQPNQTPDTRQGKEHPPKPPAAGAAGFGEFWAAWPRKVARADAQKAWDKINPDEVLQGEILAAIEANVSSNPQWTKDNGQFIPYPATWLRGRQWEDQFEPAAANDHWAGVAL